MATNRDQGGQKYSKCMKIKCQSQPCSCFIVRTLWSGIREGSIDLLTSNITSWDQDSTFARAFLRNHSFYKKKFKAHNLNMGYVSFIKSIFIVARMNFNQVYKQAYNDTTILESVAAVLKARAKVYLSLCSLQASPYFLYLSAYRRYCAFQ